MDARIRTEIEAAQLALLQAGHETQELLDALHSIAAAGRAAAQWHHVDRMRGAIAVLRESTRYDEKTGEWSYRTKRDGVDEDLDLEGGVADFIESDEGKSYLAPAQQQQQPRGGSGHRPVGGNGGQPRVQNGGRPTADPKAAKAQAKQAAMGDLSKAIDSLAGGNVNLG